MLKKRSTDCHNGQKIWYKILFICSKNIFISSVKTRPNFSQGIFVINWGSLQLVPSSLKEVSYSTRLMNVINFAQRAVQTILQTYSKAQKEHT